MSDPGQSQSLATTLIAEVTLMVTNPYFLGLLISGWAAGWLCWKFWYKHEISNLKSDVSTAEARTIFWKEKYELQRDLHKALRDDISKREKADTNEILAREIAKAPPGIRRLLARLVRGDKIETPVNPGQSPDRWATSLVAKTEDLSRVVMLSNMGSVSITSPTVVYGTTSYVTSATEDAQKTLRRVDEIQKSDKDDDKKS